MHRALQIAGRACSRRARPADRRAARKAVEGLVRLARRYPTQRFRLDGEDARMLSVLLVARNELSCAPGTAAVIDRALPPNVRSAVRQDRRPKRSSAP